MLLWLIVQAAAVVNSALSCLIDSKSNGNCTASTLKFNQVGWTSTVWNLLSFAKFCIEFHCRYLGLMVAIQSSFDLMFPSLTVPVTEHKLLSINRRRCSQWEEFGNNLFPVYSPIRTSIEISDFTMYIRLLSHTIHSDGAVLILSGSR